MGNTAVIVLTCVSLGLLCYAATREKPPLVRSGPPSAELYSPCPAPAPDPAPVPFQEADLLGLIPISVVWSRGYFDLVHLDNPQIPMGYFMKPTEHLSPPDSMAKDFANLQGWVWVRTGSHFNRPNDLEQFVRTVMPNITKPIRLISGDGDAGVPGSLVPGVADAILEHPMVNVWYTQNYDGSMNHPKIRPLPIGLDLHFGFNIAAEKRLTPLFRAAAESAIPAERQDAVFVGALGNTNPERAVMYAALESTPHVIFSNQRVDYVDAMREYGRYRFAVSPRGNGIDCHRTWELLTMRTIPILLTSSIDSLFEKLPVVIVKDWAEVRDQSNLERWFNEHAPKLELPGTTWINRARFVDMSPLN